MSSHTNRPNAGRINGMTVAGVIFAALLTLAYLAFFVSTLLPLWRTRSTLLQRQQFAQEKQTGQFVVGPDDLLTIEERTALLEAQLREKTAVFLTEPQAAATLDLFFQYAALASVDIVNLEAAPSQAKGANVPFDVRQFRVELVGDGERLLTFLSLLRETAVFTVSPTNVQFNRNGENSTLSFDLLLYTSPFSSGEALSNLPATEGAFVPPVTTPPEASLNPADALFAQLDAPWQAEDWPTVLTLIDQIIVIDPTYPDIREKQYGALVNDGYRLFEGGDVEGARGRFETAVVLNPQSGEAQAGLAALEAQTNPATTYTVQSGDTLFSIAQRYNITVAQLRTANGLTSNTITPGQQLIIP